MCVHAGTRMCLRVYRGHRVRVRTHTVPWVYLCVRTGVREGGSVHACAHAGTRVCLCVYRGYRVRSQVVKEVRMQGYVCVCVCAGGAQGLWLGGCSSGRQYAVPLCVPVRRQQRGSRHHCPGHTARAIPAAARVPRIPPRQRPGAAAGGRALGLPRWVSPPGVGSPAPPQGEADQAVLELAVPGGPCLHTLGGSWRGGSRVSTPGTPGTPHIPHSACACGLAVGLAWGWQEQMVGLLAAVTRCHGIPSAWGDQQNGGTWGSPSSTGLGWEGAGTGLQPWPWQAALAGPAATARRRSMEYVCGCR